MFISIQPTFFFSIHDSASAGWSVDYFDGVALYPIESDKSICIVLIWAEYYFAINSISRDTQSI